MRMKLVAVCLMTARGRGGGREPDIFVPVAGGWGRRGSTNVRLVPADAATLESALTMAWRNVASQAVVKHRDGVRAADAGRTGSRRAPRPR